MSAAVITVAVVVVLVWVYLIFFRGGYWRVRLSPAVTTTSHPTVVAVIPARNEADVIAQSVASLLAQPAINHVIVVDDASNDGTPICAQAAAHKLGRPGSLAVLQGAALPAGWSGKLWALAQGIEHARSFDPQFLLLTDADVVHHPADISALLAKAEVDRFDLVSLMVKLHCETTAEKLLIPAFVCFFFMLYPPAWISSADRRSAGAAGGCILIRPDALEGSGGLAGIRGEIIDDCALARAVKRSGGRVWLGLARSARSIRRYGSLSQIGHMISRTAFSQLNHSSWLLAVTVLGLTLTYLAPVALLISAIPAAVAMGALACALMVVSYVPMIRFYGCNAAWALTLPVAAAFYGGATVNSALRYWRGRGGEWKGRIQDASDRPLTRDAESNT